MTVSTLRKPATKRQIAAWEAQKAEWTARSAAQLAQIEAEMTAAGYVKTTVGEWDGVSEAVYYGWSSHLYNSPEEAAKHGYVFHRPGSTHWIVAQYWPHTVNLRTGQSWSKWYLLYEPWNDISRQNRAYHYAKPDAIIYVKAA